MVALLIKVMTKVEVLVFSMAVTLPVVNLFDTEPEEVPDGNDMNIVPNIYDVVGRTFFVNTSYKF